MAEVDIIIRKYIDENDPDGLASFLLQIPRDRTTVGIFTANLHHLVCSDISGEKSLSLYRSLLQHGASADVPITIEAHMFPWLENRILSAPLFMIAYRFSLEKIELMYQYSSICWIFSLQRLSSAQSLSTPPQMEWNRGVVSQPDRSKSSTSSKPNLTARNKILARYSHLFRNKAQEEESPQPQTTLPDQHTRSGPLPVSAAETTASSTALPSSAASTTTSETGVDSVPIDERSKSTVTPLSLFQLVALKHQWASLDPASWHPFSLMLSIAPDNIPALASIAFNSISHRTGQLDFSLIDVLFTNFCYKEATMPRIPSKTLAWLRRLLFLVFASAKEDSSVRPSEESLCTATTIASAHSDKDHGDTSHNDFSGPSNLEKFLMDTINGLGLDQQGSRVVAAQDEQTASQEASKDHRLSPDGDSPAFSETTMDSTLSPKIPVGLQCLITTHLLNAVCNSPFAREFHWVLDLFPNCPWDEIWPPPWYLVNPSLYRDAHGCYILNFLLSNSMLSFCPRTSTSILAGSSTQQSRRVVESILCNAILNNQDDRPGIELFYKDDPDLSDISDPLTYSILYNRHVPSSCSLARDGDVFDQHYDSNVYHRQVAWNAADYNHRQAMKLSSVLHHEERDMDEVPSHAANHPDSHDSPHELIPRRKDWGHFIIQLTLDRVLDNIISDHPHD